MSTLLDTSRKRKRGLSTTNISTSGLKPIAEPDQDSDKRPKQGGPGLKPTRNPQKSELNSNTKSIGGHQNNENNFLKNIPHCSIGEELLESSNEESEFGKKRSEASETKGINSANSFLLKYIARSPAEVITESSEDEDDPMADDQYDGDDRMIVSKADNDIFFENQATEFKSSAADFFQAYISSNSKWNDQNGSTESLIGSVESPNDADSDYVQSNGSGPIMPRLPSVAPLPENQHLHGYNYQDDLSRKIMSIFELWNPVLLYYDTVAPEQWFDYSILNLMLMKYYYATYPDVNAAYLDTSTLEMLDVDESIREIVMQVGIPRFRERYFLPLNTSCPVTPKVFVVRQNQNHFFAVYMDHEHRTVTVFGRTPHSGDNSWHHQNERDFWTQWGGDRIYRNICVLHGWDVGSLEDVKVNSVTWDMNTHDCGPTAILAAETLILKGLSDDSKRDIITAAQSCHHITRLQIFHGIRVVLSDSIEGYNYFQKAPPDEWASFDVTFMERTYLPSHPGELSHLWSSKCEVLQKLYSAISVCPHCRMKARPMTQVSEQEEGMDVLWDKPLDRTSPDPIELEAPLNQGSTSVDLDKLDKSRTRRLYMPRSSDTNKVSLRRNQPLSRPCDLPLPSPPLWPRHNPIFDEYESGPTHEDMHAYEDPVHAFPIHHPILSSVHYKSPWIYFRDYGHRLLTRFAHTYYLGCPQLLDEHIMPSVPSFSLERVQNIFCDLVEPRPSGRDGDPGRTVVSNDVEILGAREILARISSSGEPQDKIDLISYMVRRKTAAGKFVALDLERDSLPSDQISVKMSVDIDSIVWVTNLARPSRSVSLMLTPCFNTNYGIKKHNHVYVEVLPPPTDEERTTSRSWQERRVPVSNIPHTLFAKFSEGNSPVLCYIFFPRMIHRNEYTRKIQTNIPQDLLVWFWNWVVLPALRKTVQGTIHEPFYEFSVEDNIRKQPGKNKHLNNQFFYNGMSKVVPHHIFEQLQREMRIILGSEDLQQQISRFKSFFFVVESNGYKLNVMADNGDTVYSNLLNSGSGIDWEYALNRENGELHMDIGFSYHPKRETVGELDNNEKDKTGVVGMWRMNYLEESFAKAGFKAGREHQINTLPNFGARQAEMTLERSRITHVLYRSVYNLLYEVFRKKDNNPWLCSDVDAFNVTETFLATCADKIKQYRGLGSRSYGVRDEYRVSGEAAKNILQGAERAYRRFVGSHGVLWMPTHVWFDFISKRMEALTYAVICLKKLSPANHAVVCGVLMHLMRCVESTPMIVPAHVRGSLADLAMDSISSRFGMMFLHDLHLDGNPIVLPEVVQQDDKQLRAEMDIGKPRRTHDFIVNSRITEEYPLGPAPTWRQVKERLNSRQPHGIIKFWMKPTVLDHTPTKAGLLFVNFTASMWISLKEDWKETTVSDFLSNMNLDDALDFWSARKILDNITSVSFSINRCGIRGAAGGKQEAKSFRDRASMYFPRESKVIPSSSSKWTPFFDDRVGYIKRYHDHIRQLKGPDERNNFDTSLGDIFHNLQCLPNSEAFSATRPGKTWSRAPRQEAIAILIDVTHMRFETISSSKNVKGTSTRIHATEGVKKTISALLKHHNLPEEHRRSTTSWKEKIGKNSNRSGRAKNRRQPPTNIRKIEQTGDSSNGQENSDDNHDQEHETESESTEHSTF